MALNLMYHVARTLLIAQFVRGIDETKMAEASEQRPPDSQNNSFLAAFSGNMLLNESASKKSKRQPKVQRREGIQAMIDKVVAIPQYHGFWMTAKVLIDILHHEFYFGDGNDLITTKEINKAFGWHPNYKLYLEAGESCNPTGVFRKGWQPKVKKGKKVTKHKIYYFTTNGDVPTDRGTAKDHHIETSLHFTRRRYYKNRDLDLDAKLKEIFGKQKTTTTDTKRTCLNQQNHQVQWIFSPLSAMIYWTLPHRPGTEACRPVVASFGGGRGRDEILLCYQNNHVCLLWTRTPTRPGKNIPVTLTVLKVVV